MFTKGETVLLIITVVVVAAGAIMAVLIGLVLPKEYLDEDYVPDVIKPRPLISSSILDEKKYLSYSDIKEYPYLVSLTLPLYIDYPESDFFGCTGVAISESLVLTGQDCIEPQDPSYGQNYFKKATVRSESSYFCNGTTHTVKKYFSSDLDFPYSEFYIVKVEPAFSSDVKPVRFPFSDETYSKLEKTNLNLLGWGGKKDPKNSLLKYEKFHVETWSRTCKSSDGSEDSANCLKGTLTDSVEASSHLNGRPLLAGDFILGMQFNFEGQKNDTKFLSVRNEKFLKWIQELTESSDKISVESETVELFVPFR